MLGTTEKAYYVCGIHLWRAVIHRAIEEAEGEIVAYEPGWALRRFTAKEKKAHRARETAKVKARARRWLTSDTVFLRRVVEMACFHVEFEVFLGMMRGRFKG